MKESRNSKNRNAIAIVQRRLNIGKAKWLFGMMTILVGGFGLILWANAQSADTASLDPTVERELARAAILDPVGFEQEMAKYKTGDDILAEQWAAYSILNPAAFSQLREGQKTPEQRNIEEWAAYAILQPDAYSAEIEKLKDEQYKAMEAAAKDAILNPKVMSSLTPEGQ